VGKQIRVRTLAAVITCGAAMMMLGAGVGDAADAPAITGQASSVNSTSAQLNGTVHPGGLDTFWAFQYGTSTNYGQNTTPVGPLTGTTGNSVSTEVKDLQPGTTYHFRLIAIQGAAGTSGESNGSTGSDETFTTAGSGSTISTTSKSGAKKVKATLRSHTFSVRKGAAVIPWGCSGTAGASCQVKMSLSARGKIAGKLETVSCGHGTFKAKTGKHNSVRAALGSKCLALVKAAPHERLAASLKATSSAGGGLKAKVTLVG
jgi:hypothetical protein